jgi:leucyl aminopeptidase (aminopeptidase T)
MLSSIKQLLIQLFWPLIKEFLKSVLKEFLAWALNKVKEILQQQSANTRKTAQAKAEAAEAQARNATTKEEADQYAATAKVWREVAETLRQENEALKKKIDDFQQQATSKVDDAVETMHFDDHFDSSGTDLKLHENRPTLGLEDKNKRKT